MNSRKRSLDIFKTKTPIESIATNHDAEENVKKAHEINRETSPEQIARWKETNNIPLSIRRYLFNSNDAELIEKNPELVKVIDTYFDELARFMLSTEQYVALSQIPNGVEYIEFLGKHAKFLKEKLHISTPQFMTMAETWNMHEINSLISYGEELQEIGFTFEELSDLLETKNRKKMEALVMHGIPLLLLGFNKNEVYQIANRDNSAFTMQAFEKHGAALINQFQLTIADLVWIATRPAGVASTIEFIISKQNKLMAQGFIGAAAFRELFAKKSHNERANILRQRLGCMLPPLQAPPPATPLVPTQPSVALPNIDYQSASTSVAPIRIKSEPLDDLSNEEITQRITRAIYALRGLSVATHNCAHLASDLLKYFRGRGFPTNPSLTAANTLEESGLNVTRAIDDIVIKKELTSYDKAETRITSAIRSNIYTNNIFFKKAGQPIAQHYPQANFVESANTNDVDNSRLVEQYDVDEPLVNNTQEYKEYASAAQDINIRLLRLADTRPGKILCGTISLVPANKHIREPGHVIPFYVANNQVWYVDGQFIQNGQENAAKPSVFHNLTQTYRFATRPSDIGFSPRVFFVPFDASLLAQDPEIENSNSIALRRRK